MIPEEKLSRSYRIFAVLALALVSYSATLKVGFMWDDHVMIEANPALREWSLRTLKHDFTTDVFDGHGDPYYRPAQTVLNRIDYSIWGLSPFGYHLTNFLSHAANAVLVGELAIALGLGSLPALLAACLFAVHPIPVEQLLIIAGRAELFGLAFVLLSLLLLLRKEPRSWLLGYTAFVIALFFKESALITPVLLSCLYAYKRRPIKDYWRTLPFLLLSLPYLWIRHFAVGSLLPHFELSYITLFFTKAFANILLIYVRILLIPWDLHSHRAVPHLSYAWPLLLAILISFPVYLYRKKMFLGLLGFSWFILMLLPKTPIMIYGNFTLDHWAYPASIGLHLVLAAGFTRLWEGRKNIVYYVLGASFVPLLIVWSLLVHVNVYLRGTDEKIYRQALLFTRSSPIKYNLGLLLLQTGRAREAAMHLEDYRRLYPEDPRAVLALAEAYRQAGRASHAAKILKNFRGALPK